MGRHQCTLDTCPPKRIQVGCPTCVASQGALPDPPASAAFAAMLLCNHRHNPRGGKGEGSIGAVRGLALLPLTAKILVSGT